MRQAFISTFLKKSNLIFIKNVKITYQSHKIHSGAKLIKMIIKTKKDKERNKTLSFIEPHSCDINFKHGFESMCSYLNSCLTESYGAPEGTFITTEIETRKLE